MNNNENVTGNLTKRDLELVEKIIYKNNDDVAVSIARSFERLEERIDSTESRIYSRLSDVEDKLESNRQDSTDTLGEMADNLKGLREAVSGGKN